MSNNPSEVQTESKGQDQGNIQKHGQNQTREIKLGKLGNALIVARLNNTLR